MYRDGTAVYSNSNALEIVIDYCSTPVVITPQNPPDYSYIALVDAHPKIESPSITSFITTSDAQCAFSTCTILKAASALSCTPTSSDADISASISGSTVTISTNTNAVKSLANYCLSCQTNDPIYAKQIYSQPFSIEVTAAVCSNYITITPISGSPFAYDVAATNQPMQSVLVGSVYSSTSQSAACPLSY